MNQVLLYSINSEYLISIRNGHKTIEVRKRDLPQWAKDKLARGEKVVGYGYCTKSFPYIEYVDFEGDHLYYEEQRNIPEWNLNGRVIVKFEVSNVTRHNPTHFKPPKSRFSFFSGYAISDKEMKDMCLDKYDLDSYGNGHVLYAHHLTNITPIEPMELWKFVTRDIKPWYGEDGWITHWKPLTKPPQPFITCWMEGEQG